MTNLPARASRWLAPFLCLQSFILVSDAFSSVSWKHRSARSNTKLPIASDIAAEWRSFNETELLEDDSIAITTAQDVCTVQILMSDTGGGHRASANALRDALQVLYPGKFECEIVDIYMDYGPFWPFNDVVNMYKLMAEHSWSWDLFFKFGETDFGLLMHDFILQSICYQPFQKCLEQKFESSNKRADIVVSVHPLCQELPLTILSDLDARDEQKSNPPECRKTPFVTVVTDLGGAHKTWFHPGRFLESLFSASFVCAVCRLPVFIFSF